MDKDTLNLIIERKKQLKKAKICFGITSKCEDNKHIVFLDFDNISYAKVYETVKHMQICYNLSTFYIIKSTNGFNAFSLSKMEFKDLVAMLKGYKSIDPLFIELCKKKHNQFVLRMGFDKIFNGAIHYKPENEDLSLAHYIFFTDIMNYPIEEIHNYDTNKILRIIAYKSVKHGFCKIKSLSYLREFNGEENNEFDYTHR